MGKTISEILIDAIQHGVKIEIQRDYQCQAVEIRAEKVVGYSEELFRPIRASQTQLVALVDLRNAISIEEIIKFNLEKVIRDLVNREGEYKKCLLTTNLQ